MRRLSIAAAVTLVVDLVTKVIVVDRMPLYGPPVEVIVSFLQLIHVQNHGSAFSLFEGGRFFFIGFSLVSIILILLLARNPRYRKSYFALSLGLILGGALGNLADRIVYGAVTDWIDVGIGATRWPTFNVADIGVTVGVLVLALLLLRSPSDAGAQSGELTEDS